MAGSVSATPYRIAARPTPVATPVFDQAIADIADYICDYECSSALVYETARLCLLNALGCGMEALEYPVCTSSSAPSFLARSFPMERRFRVPRTYSTPATAAFNLGTMMRWLDFNDCWQERSAQEPGRSRPLRTVHGCRATALAS